MLRFAGKNTIDININIFIHFLNGKNNTIPTVIHKNEVSLKSKFVHGHIMSKKQRKSNPMQS